MKCIHSRNKILFIQSFCGKYGAATTRKIVELKNTISNLKSMQQSLISRHQDMATILKIDSSSICITEQKKSYLVTVPTTADASAGTEVERIY